mgnify:CR=1 FL=1
MKMNQNNIQQEISIIKNMIEKTNRNTAESGALFIFIGIACIAYVGIITILELLGLFSWVLPAMLGMTVILAVVGGIVAGRIDRKVKVKTYANVINRTIITVCSFAILITSLLFPFTHVYAWVFAPMFAALIFGIMLFLSAVVNELNVFYWGGSVAWAGALIMAYTQNVQFPVRGIVMVVILITGFILPGVALNRKFKQEPKS